MEFLWTLSFIIALFAVPYCLMIAMPSWRWLLACFLLGAGYLSYEWLQLWPAIRKDHEPGDGLAPVMIAFGYLAMMLHTLGLGIGALVRSGTLVAAGRGTSRKRIWAIHGAGLLLVLAVAAAPFFLVLKAAPA